MKFVSLPEDCARVLSGVHTFLPREGFIILSLTCETRAGEVKTVTYVRDYDKRSEPQFGKEYVANETVTWVPTKPDPLTQLRNDLTGDAPLTPEQLKMLARRIEEYELDKGTAQPELRRLLAGRRKA